MESLEKMMLFIPNRYTPMGQEMYVSFNIAVIPADMAVTAMTLIVPTPRRAGAVRLHLHEIERAWDEVSIHQSRPAIAPAGNVLTLEAGEREGKFAIGHLAAPWRFDSYENHGVCVRLESGEPIQFDIEDPPYLLAATV